MLDKTILDKIASAKKIAVFGWPATGKSTFSLGLSDILKIHLSSLDELRWRDVENGKKNDEKFLKEYNKIIKKESWIIEGNALDWIDSRLEYSDIVFYFDSTPKQCIELYHRRKNYLKQKELDKRTLAENLHIMEDGFDEWVKTRYSKKIENLKPVLKNYNDKVIVIKTFDDVDSALSEIKRSINIKNI